MADKFFVEAETTWEIGAGGSPLDPNFIVRVKDEFGDPVTGLKKQNFKIFDVGFGFSQLTIFSFQEIAVTGPSLPFLPGTYIIRIKRSNLMTGQFAYAIIVSHSRGRKTEKALTGGQTFVSAVKLA